MTTELRDVTRALKVRQRLAGWARVLKQLPRRDVGQFRWLLLVLNLKDNTIRVTGFTPRGRASRALDEMERLKRDDLDAVLRWVNSIRDLKTAYPNYYADTGEFIDS